MSAFGEEVPSLLSQKILAFSKGVEENSQEIRVQRNDSFFPIFFQKKLFSRFKKIIKIY